MTHAVTLSQIFCLETPHPNPGGGGGGGGFKGQNSTFLEHGHVAYQIKWNHECSNMVANILPAEPPDPLGMGVKGQNSFFFRIW